MSAKNTVATPLNLPFVSCRAAPSQVPPRGRHWKDQWMSVRWWMESNRLLVSFVQTHRPMVFSMSRKWWGRRSIRWRGGLAKKYYSSNWNKTFWIYWLGRIVFEFSSKNCGKYMGHWVTNPNVSLQKKSNKTKTISWKNGTKLRENTNWCNNTLLE